MPKQSIANILKLTTRPIPAQAEQAVCEPKNQTRHIRCPVCSFWAPEDFILHGPHLSRVRYHRFGCRKIEWDSELQDITEADRQLLIGKLTSALELLQGVTPSEADVQVPVAPGALPAIVKAVEPKRKKTQAEIAIKTMMDTATTELLDRSLFSNVINVPDDEGKKDAIQALWDYACNNEQESLLCKAYFALHDDQRERVLSSVVRQLKGE